MTTSDETKAFDPLGPEMATLGWQQLATQIDALADAWRTGPRPPDLRVFLPREPAELRRLILSELIKLDLEYRWQQFELPKTVEEYLADFPELAACGMVPNDLIHEEYHVRRQTTDAQKPEDYLKRFPQQEAALRRLFAIDKQAAASTTLAVGGRRPPSEIGDRIDDFDILVCLGKGAFGSVYLARQRSMQRLVALKVTRDQGSESQTLAQLDHPNVVRVYDQRVLPERELRLMYMENVPGGTLQGVLEAARAAGAAQRSGKTVLESIDTSLERQGVVAPHDSSLRQRLGVSTWAQSICWLGARLAAALDYAHRKGVLHRDVKPANVLLAADGSPKLADFNVSFSSKLDGASPAAFFGGSLAYMSPEQLEASNPNHSRQPDELDGRSDVYSLAVMLWELLTGERPFGEERMAAEMSFTLTLLAERRRAGVPAKALEKLPASLPGDMDQVLLGCLAPEPSDRPATAGALARQLDICLQPRAQRLFRPRAGTWRQFMQRHALLFLVLAGVIPHAIPSTFNTIFNGFQIVKEMPEEIQRIFWHVMVPVVNGVCYTLGAGLGISLVLPVLVTALSLRRGQAVEAKRLSALRRRSLWIGDYVAWIGYFLWFSSGVAFTLWLAIVGGWSPDRAKLFYDFFVSQLVCGFIASSQTFFLLTCVSLRALHPLLLSPDQSDADELNDLARLDRRSVWYLGLAVAAPFVAFLALILTKHTEGGNAIGLFVIGLVCSVVAYGLWRTIQQDVGALFAALDPFRRSGHVGMDSTDSFLTSSR